jgi:hypothetical protein
MLVTLAHCLIFVWASCSSSFTTYPKTLSRDYLTQFTHTRRHYAIQKFFFEAASVIKFAKLRGHVIKFYGNNQIQRLGTVRAVQSCCPWYMTDRRSQKPKRSCHQMGSATCICWDTILAPPSKLAAFSATLERKIPEKMSQLIA